MKLRIKDAVVFIIIATAYAAAGVEIRSQRECVPCDREPGHMRATLSSSRSVAVKGPSSPNDIGSNASWTSPDTCWLQLTAAKAGSILLEMRASSQGAGKNLSASQLTLSLQRKNGTVIYRNISTAGPLWLLPVEQDDQLNVTWRMTNNSSLELHASLITNGSCGDDSMVKFRGACYVLRSTADAGGMSSQLLAEFGAQFQDEKQLQAFVHHALLTLPTLKDNFNAPVLLGMKYCNGQLMYLNHTIGPDQQCQWTEFYGSTGSNLTRSVLIGATEVEHPLVTLMATRSSEPELGLISSKEAASGRHQVLLKFSASAGFSKCDANSNAARGCHAGDQASSKLGVVLGSIAAAVCIAAALVIAAVAIRHIRCGNLSCPILGNHLSPTGASCKHNGKGNNASNGNNGASNGDETARGCLLNEAKSRV